MEKDILSQVIEVEKEIQKCLEIEKASVREWLDDVRKESEEEYHIQEEKIKASLDQSLAEAAKQAEEASAAILEQAAATAERLGQVKTEILTGIIQSQIARILPG